MLSRYAGNSVASSPQTSNKPVLVDLGGSAGDVDGPASSVNLSIPVFSGVTGKILADPNIAFISGSSLYVGGIFGTAQFNVNGLTSTSGMVARNWANNTDAPFFITQKSRGAAIGTHGIVSNGDNIGTTQFQGSDGAAFLVGAQIKGTVDGAPGVNNLPTALVFSTNPGAAAVTESMRIASNKTVSMQGLLDISAATAGQIKFPATQNASANANTLDDYEEGTFTFTVAFGGASTGITYSFQTGKYTKIGNQCVITGLLNLSNKGSATGAATILGAPFPTGAGTGSYGSGSGTSGAFTLAALNYGVGYFINQGGSSTIFPYSNSNVGTTNLTDANFSNTSSVTVSIIYPTV